MGKQNKENTGAPSIESLVKRGYLFIEDSDWDKADEYFDKALDIDPEYASAYIGKLCVELRVKNEEALGNYQELRQGKKFDKLLGEYGNFQKALRFADSGYSKKLNGYEQEIKEKFPKKIPQKFTDKFIKSEIARLEKEIANYDAEIAEWKDQERAEQYNADFYIKKNEIKYDAVYRVQGRYDADYYTKRDPEYQSNEKQIADFLNKKQAAQQRVKEYTGKKAEYEAQKQEIEKLAGISCLDRLDRIDVHYNRYTEAMKKKPTENEYGNIAKQFRLLEGYKDSKKLADECEKLAVKTKYDNLVQRKNKASSEDEYKKLAQKFRKMGAYENSAQLADDCEKLAVKTKYDNLVLEKNNENFSSYEDKYAQLARKFREMGSYENSAQLADECEKQVRVIKERRAEQKRQFDERQRKEAAEREVEKARLEQERKIKEAEEKRKKRIKRIIGFCLTFVPYVLGLVLYAFSLDVFGKYGVENVGFLIIPLIMVIPLVRIHYRDDSRIPSIVIFCIGLIYMMCLYGSLWSSLAMIVSFIMALVYPAEKYL